MTCTKCDIVKYAIDSANRNNIILTKAKIIGRIIYEQLQANESFTKAPAGEGSDFAACVKKMTGKPRKKGGPPRTEEEAKALCASIGRKKFGKGKFQKMAAKGRTESSAKNEMVLMKKINNNEPVTSEEALAQYELAFKDVLDIKLRPVKNLEEIEQLREQLWKAEDRMYDARNAYKRVATGNEDELESNLLNIRLKIRENKNGIKKEGIVQNQKKVHETETSTRKRQFDPSECQEGTFRTIPLGESGKKGVICKKKGEDSTSLQSIITPKKKKEAVVQNEDFLGNMQGKNRNEQLEILEKANPDIDRDILEDMLN